jgi:drug/metabolite transporter (DMT)-like permease
LNKSNIKYTLCLVLTAVIWGVAFVAQEKSVDLMGAFTYSGVRFLLGAVSIIPVIAIFERGKSTKPQRRSTLLCGLVVGLVLFAAVTLQQFGIQITRSAGKSGFITGLYIVFVPVVGIFMKKHTTLFTWIGVVFAISGLYLLSVTDGFGSIGTGDLLLVGGAVCWTFHIILIDRFAPRIRALRFSMVQFTVCGVISLACAFIFEDIRLIQLKNGLVPLLYGGLLSVGVAYTLQTIGQKKVPPAKAAIIFSMESLFAALGGALISHERMSMRGYLGCACIFAGILLSQIVVQRRKNTNGVGSSAE